MQSIHEQVHSVTRRYFFKECGVGVGKIALAALLTNAPPPANPPPPWHFRVIH
jgi:hypothetical protein